MSDIILKAENISKQYRLGNVGSGTLRDDFKRSLARIRGKEDPFLKVGAVNDRSQKSTEDYVWALRDINFEVQQGEVLGIIGKNGAGKSTLLKILSRVTAPSTGVIKSRGRIASLLEVGTGFNHELTGRENIFLNGAILGMTKTEISSKLDEIIDFSGCERYIDTPTKRYSSGMTVRLAFAVAAFLEPEILVVDEVLAVGDAEFQKKAIGKMQDISKGEGRTVLFVSHNMASVRSLCSRGVLLENGYVKKEGNVGEIISDYINVTHKPIKYDVIEHELFYINKFEIKTASGLSKTSFKNGDDIVFKIHLTLLKSNPDLGFCVAIYNEVRDLIAPLNTYHANDKFSSLDKGEFEVLIKIDKYILNSGFYSVDLYVNTIKGQLYAYNKDVLTFNIIDDGYRGGKFFFGPYNGMTGIIPRVDVF